MDPHQSAEEFIGLIVNIKEAHTAGEIFFGREGGGRLLEGGRFVSTFAFGEESVDILLGHEGLFLGWLLSGVMGLMSVDGLVELC